jgi:alpha-ketoglutarate-dependent taurine dioxygenase
MSSLVEAYAPLLEGRPPVLRAYANSNTEGWVADNLDILHAALRGHGTVVVRGLDVADAARAGRLARLITTELITERESFAPRTAYAPQVYTSSAWPANQPMCMHHELSYAQELPATSVFACLKAPTAGGETAVADAAAVLADLPADIVSRFEKDGWQLIRNYGETIGVPWQQAFGTDDPSEVEAYCRANDTEFEWTDAGLRTRQRRTAVAHHPVTGQRVWFNQIAFLNELTMDPDVREYLAMVLGPDGLPFTTRFGDGEPIPAEIVDVINDVYQRHTASIPWQRGDLMLVDNLRTAHSRQPYDGDREIVVAMGDPVRRTDIRWSSS